MRQHVAVEDALGVLAPRRPAAIAPSRRRRSRRPRWLDDRREARVGDQVQSPSAVREIGSVSWIAPGRSMLSSTSSETDQRVEVGVGRLAVEQELVRAPPSAAVRVERDADQVRAAEGVRHHRAVGVAQPPELGRVAEEVVGDRVEPLAVEAAVIAQRPAPGPAAATITACTMVPSGRTTV